MNSRTGVLTVVSLGALLFIYLPTEVKAQIIPDQTLPNNSLVNQKGRTSLIEGGTIRHNNLFHSFENFSVLTGGTAYFKNPLTTQNIISRITGSSVSSIDGLLKANGTANLFLINPSGIIFGPNAALELGGSFLGTTADTIEFADGFELSTDDKSPPPLLTIEAPTGLDFIGKPGTIRVEGTGADLTFGSSNSSGLQVQPGKTLGLIGGEVKLDGGVLTAQGGGVELAAVNSGQVSFKPATFGLAFNYDRVISSRGIWLSWNSLVDVSGVSSGSIHLQGDDIALRSGSRLWSQNLGTTKGGSISISSSNLSLEGVSTDGRISTAIISDTLGRGNGGDIDISTGDLGVGSGSAIFTSSSDVADGGDVTINASKSVNVAGDALGVPFIRTVIGAFTFGLGSGGDLTLTTEKLTVSNQSALNTVTFGPGQGGNSILTAKEFLVSNGGTVGTFTFSSGKGGNQTVKADTVKLVGEAPTILSPSVINAASFSSGDAGNLVIETRQLAVKEGARVDTAALSSGNAGRNLTINASESVEVSGVGPTTGTPSSIDSSASILSKSLQETFGLPPIPTGNSGNVTVTTKKLSVRDSGQISARNDGPGAGGTLQIKAEVLKLENQSAITASTAGGEQGDIDLKLDSLLLLRNGSSITASAQGRGNGGNVTIDPSLVLLLEGSRISADAQKGSGGQVSITTRGLIVSPDSSITATSEQGPEYSGIIELNVPDIEFSRAAAQPVSGPKSPNVISACNDNTTAKAATFINGHSGGIPPSPTDSLTGDTLWHGITPSNQESQTKAVAEETDLDTAPEAVGWIRNSNGTISLTADGSKLASQSSPISTSCR